MENNLIFLQVCPSDLYFVWQTELQLKNFKELEYISKYNVLIFTPYDRLETDSDNIKNWKLLEKKYSEANFFYYRDETKKCWNDTQSSQYIPLLRPYCLKEHFKAYPELKDKYIFYFDSDILLTKKIPFKELIKGHSNYISDASSYMNYNYFCYKRQNAPKLTEDQLFSGICNHFKISKEDIINKPTGGVQYLFEPGLTENFWNKVYHGCVFIRQYLMVINQLYFPGNNKVEKENNGFQSWCADLHSILYTLWEENKSVEISKILDFAWATDSIKKIEEVYIYHNAGVSGQVMNLNNERTRMFWKGTYTNNTHTPEQDIEYLNNVDKRYASSYYAQKLIELYNK